MEAVVLPALMIVAGLYFGLRNIRLLLSEAALRDYMQSSPKGAAWVARFGIERATKMAKGITVPLGIVVSLALVGMGAWALQRALL
jgi:hypothetical protein